MNIKINDWIKQLPSFKSSFIPLIKSGNLIELQEYSIALGIDLTQFLNRNIYNDNEFLSLNNKDKALFIRNEIVPAVVASHNLSSALSFESVQEILKGKGLLFTPANASSIDERLKAIVAGGLKYIIDEDNLNAGLNVYNSGFQQIINNAPRSLINNTSIKTFERIGEPLKGQRVIAVYADACDYCREKAREPFDLGFVESFEGFHDFCSCRLEIL